MTRRRLIWYLFPTYLVVIAAALVAVTAYTSRSVRSFYEDQTRERLEAHARILMPRVRTLLANTAGRDELDALCKAMGRVSETRITIILPDGKVIGDTYEDPSTMDRHDKRPEVLEAKAKGVGSAKRHSDTLGEMLTYVAISVQSQDKLLGYIRVAMLMTAIKDKLHAIFYQVASGSLIVAFFGAVLSWIVARRIARPLEALRRGADRFARGELSERLPVPRADEIAGLAEALNKMAEQLHDRIQTIVNQRNEQQAVLSSMVESVLAVDKDERILSINDAAAKLLEADVETAVGRSLRSVARNSSLHDFVVKALASQAPVEDELVFNTKSRGEQILQVHGTALQGVSGRRDGVVIVLNDITRLRRLEKVRRDFVANVSHELKTPITTIKGFVETLLHGSVEPSDTSRFLGIVLAQADRLNAIIEDLLILSRLEGEKADPTLEPGHVDAVVRSAIDFCAPRAKARDITVRLHVESPAEGRINPALLEQAVVNLIDNAIKYSDEGSLIDVSTTVDDGGIAIVVSDHGRGISAEHQPRIFERFYRVDKSRSRELGGTGLGLAIVKHIAQAHGGNIDVESRPGEGSTFTLRLPVIEDPESQGALKRTAPPSPLIP